jgi:hypothetical protein
MKILVFAPHSEIWVHAFPEALLAESLQNGGNAIVYVGCGGQFHRFCVPMSSHGLTPQSNEIDRRRICDRCRRNESLIRSQFGFRGANVADLVSSSDGAVDRLIRSADRDALLDFEQDGIMIGKIALYQLMLRTKRIDLEFSDQQWDDYKVEFRNTYYSWEAGQKVLEAENPDRVLVYNSLYSVNRVVCKLAERRGIPYYFAHAGGNIANRLQTLWVGRGDPFSFMPHLVKQWPRFSNLPCGDRDLALITEHYLELLRARSAFVYSRPKSSTYFDVRERFRVAPWQKLLVATLGSYDEEKAAEFVGARVFEKKPLFETQVEWIDSVVQYVADRPDYFLLVRVHPREFPNKRDGALSQHARELAQRLADLPPNVAVNWPDDGISMYDLADQTDVFLNSWSSVGKEMALLGIPVVIYAPEITFYPKELGYSGETKAEYFAAIDQALADGWSFERVRLAYRWYVFEFIRAVIELGEDYPKNEGARLSFRERLLARLDRTYGLNLEKLWDCFFRSSNLAQSGTIAALLEKQALSVVDLLQPQVAGEATLADETISLKREVGRIADALFPDQETRVRSRLYHALSGGV